MATYQERIPQVKQQQPKRKSNRKLLFILLIFFLAVLIVIFIRSPYSKISEIQVDGNDMYSKEAIIQASGLVPGMQFFNVWQKNVQSSMSVLKGVRQVTVTRDFPGVIQLHVTEFKRVAFLTVSDGNRYPLLENGTLLKEVSFANRMVDKPLVSSWSAPELLPHLAKALAKLSPAITGEISEISLTPTAFDKQRVTLYMRDGNEVRSVVYKLDKMLVWYPAIVKEIPKGEKGIVSMFERPWFVKYGAEDQGSGGQTPGTNSDSQLQTGQQGQSPAPPSGNAAQTGQQNQTAPDSTGGQSDQQQEQQPVKTFE